MKFKRTVLLPVLLAFSGNSYALDWLLNPEFSSTERYDDNITMQTKSASKIDSMITTLSPAVLLGYQTENDELKTHFQWNELIYHNVSALDFSEKLLTVSHKHQAEWYKTGLDADYSEQSSINTQLDETGTGKISSRLIPRTTRSLSPNVLFNLSERNSLQFVYSYLDVTFQRPQNLGNLSYSDYTSQQLSATAYHNYSERLTLNLTGSYSIFESTGNNLQDFGANTDALTQHFNQKSTTFFYQAGMQYAFDELTQLSLSAGMRDTTNDSKRYYTINNSGEIFQVPGYQATQFSSNASGHVFSANLSHSEEWGNFSLNAGQQLNPSSSGQQQQTTSFSGQARYNFTERLSAGLNINHMISDSTSTFNNNSKSFNRTYTTMSPNIQWRWTEEINLQLSYTHRDQEYTDSHLTAIGNSAQLMFSYQPQINRQVK
jgi:hypothetical protein